MAIKDIFKKKEEQQEPKKKVVDKKPKPKKKVSDLAYKVLYSPHVTEKATDLTEENKYVFKVWPRSNKIQVKKAVEDTYGVNVEAVNIINVPGKKKRLGRSMGWRKGYKKAIVELKEGQKIEILPR